MKRVCCGSACPDIRCVARVRPKLYFSSFSFLEGGLYIESCSLQSFYSSRVPIRARLTTSSNDRSNPIASLAIQYPFIHRTTSFKPTTQWTNALTSRTPTTPNPRPNLRMARLANPLHLLRRPPKPPTPAAAGSSNTNACKTDPSLNVPSSYLPRTTSDSTQTVDLFHLHHHQYQSQ